jgi:hypothetical protein
MIKLINNTNMVNDTTLHILYGQLNATEGIKSCPLGNVHFREIKPDTIEATASFKDFGRLD